MNFHPTNIFSHLQSPVPTSLLVTKVNASIKEVFQAEEFRHAEEIWLAQWDTEEFI